MTQPEIFVYLLFGIILLILLLDIIHQEINDKKVNNLINRKGEKYDYKKH